MEWEKNLLSMSAQLDSDSTSEDNDMYLIESEKENYLKDEIIKFNKKELTDEDKRVILSKNTCSYLYLGRFLDKFKDMDENNDFSNFKEKINIPNKNLCFNIEQIPELNNLVDCGYADVNIITEDNKNYNYKTCFFVPNDNMPEEFKSYFRALFLEGILEQSINGIVSTMALLDEYEKYQKMINEEEDGGSRRRLTNPSFEVIVEDKTGKKIKYSSTSMTIENYPEDNGNGGTIRYNAILLFGLSLFLIIG